MGSTQANRSPNLHMKCVQLCRRVVDMVVDVRKQVISSSLYNSPFAAMKLEYRTQARRRS